MPELVLTDEQIRSFPKAPIPMTVKDAQGRVVGHLEPVPSPEWLAEMKRRAATQGPGFTPEHTKAMFDALEAERNRVGPFDGDYAVRFGDKLLALDTQKYGPEESS